jgi:mannose-6-phosphate isomerase-like protein (cupin superfamily)
MAVGERDITVAAGEGKSVSLGGMGVIFKVFGKDTGGAFAVVEYNPIEPGRLVPPHTHLREDECSYVLEGEIGVRVGDREFQARPGTYVFKPRNVPHTFWNAGKTVGRIIEIISPAGLEPYFEELSQLLFPAKGPRDMERIGALQQRYGVPRHPEWIPELKARYNLKLLGE